VIVSSHPCEKEAPVLLIFLTLEFPAMMSDFDLIFVVSAEGHWNAVCRKITLSSE